MEELERTIALSNKNKYSKRTSSKIILKKTSISAHQPKLTLPSIHQPQPLSLQNQDRYSQLNQQQFHTFFNRTQNEPKTIKNKILVLKYLIEHRNADNIYDIAKSLEENKVYGEFQHNFNILREIAREVEVMYVGRGVQVGGLGVANLRVWRMDSAEITILSQNSENTIKQSIKQSINTDQNPSRNPPKLLTFPQESLLFSLPIKSYKNWLQQYITSQTLKKIIQPTPFFQIFSLREIQMLLSQCKVINFALNEVIFAQGQIMMDTNEEKFYFIVAGNVEINVNSLEEVGRKVRICGLGVGEIFGEECLSEKEERRRYTVITKSKKLKLLQFDKKTLTNFLKKLSTPFQDYLTEILYSQRISKKLQHYTQILNRTDNFTSNLPKKPSNHSLNNHKRFLFENNLKKIENQSKRINALSKIQDKKIEAHRSVHFIDFQSPFFRRKDFPELAGQLKRFQNDEKIAQRKFQLAKISVARRIR